MSFPKYILTLFVLFFLGFLIAFLVSPFFLKPRLQNFNAYKLLSNWDVDSHAFGDFDNDGLEDFVTFTGCAFLSSANLDNISENQRCIASGSTIFDKKIKKRIGQKYIKIVDYDLLSPGGNYNFVNFSYMGQQKDGKWIIFSNTDSGDYVSMIDHGKLVSAEKNLNMNIDNFLYYVTGTLFWVGVLLVYGAPVLLILSLVIYGIFRLFSSRLE